MAQYYHDLDFIAWLCMHCQHFLIKHYILSADLEKLGESTVMSSDMLWKFLAQIQDTFLKRLVKDGVISKKLGHDDMECLPTLDSGDL